MRTLPRRTRNTAEGPSVELRLGWPTPCPQCGVTGHLDFIDLVARVMRQSCATCGVEWVTSEGSGTAAVPTATPSPCAKVDPAPVVADAAGSGAHRSATVEAPADDPIAWLLGEGAPAPPDA